MRLMSAIALLALGAPAAAQQVQPFQPGVPVRVRFTLPGEGRAFTTQVNGTLHALTADSVHIRQATERGDSQVVQVPRPAVVRLEYFTGVRAPAHPLRGLWALGGAIAGMLIGAQTVSANCNDMNCGLPPLATGAAIGALSGLAVGSVLATRRHEVWRTVDLSAPDSTKPGDEPSPGLRGHY